MRTEELVTPSYKRLLPSSHHPTSSSHVETRRQPKKPSSHSATRASRRSLITSNSTLRMMPQSSLPRTSWSGNTGASMVRRQRLARRHELTMVVLINNAGKVERAAGGDLADIRAASNSCFNNLIASNAVVTHAFDKLLRKSSWPRVIMISSARGSITRTWKKEVHAFDLVVEPALIQFSSLPLQTLTTAFPRPASICSLCTCRRRS